MSNIIPFECQGQPVRFSTDGWLNATEIAARFDKEPYGWLVSVETVAYMVALAQGLGLSLNNRILQEIKEINGLDVSRSATKARILRLCKSTGLVKTKPGPADIGGGTWLHPKLAVVFARWLDIEFAVWCDLHIDALLRGELSDYQQFENARKALSDQNERGSFAGRELAKHRWTKPPLEAQLEYWRDQIQLKLGLEVA